ncbi:MAG: YaeQ family protein [Myxococcales bacterium]|nr:YaeQ family protein [Myxococcales bacterium]
MALSATIYRWNVTLSDVDRGVYEQLELRLARHPSESLRYLWLRTLAYCLNHEEGIAFSKGGLSDTSEPPVAIVDLTGRRLAWIDVGAPSADRLHKASKSCERVLLYTDDSLTHLRKQLEKQEIFREESIEVWELPRDLISWLEGHDERALGFELVRSDGRLYLTLHGEVREAELRSARLRE